MDEIEEEDTCTIVMLDNGLVMVLLGFSVAASLRCGLTCVVFLCTM